MAYLNSSTLRIGRDDVTTVTSHSCSSIQPDPTGSLGAEMQASFVYNPFLQGWTVSGLIGNDPNSSCNVPQEYQNVCQYSGNSLHLTSQLTDHLKIHNTEPTLKCKFCNEKFARQIHLDYHELDHSVQDARNNLESYVSVMQRSGLNVHSGACALIGVDTPMTTQGMHGMQVSDQHSLEPLRLRDDSFLIPTHTEREVQVQTTHTTVGQRHRCTLCEKSFSTPNGLRNHGRMHQSHESQYGITHDNSSFPPNIIPVHAGKSFNAMPNNAFVLAQNRNYHCNDIVVHEHPDLGENASLSFQEVLLLPKIRDVVEHEQFRCDACGISFATHNDLQNHIKFHPYCRNYIKNLTFFQLTGTDVKKNIDNLNFDAHRPWESQLENHEQPEYRGKRYMCKSCGKGFQTGSLLRCHEQTHSGERPYTCKECGKGFRTGSILQCHERIHSEKRPYTCKECGKGFKQAQVLREHEQTHSEERPYTCKECGKGFKVAPALLHHELTHSEERPYTCKECGKGFKVAQALWRHGRTHSEERPYTCKVCGKFYKHSSTLREHERTQHVNGL